jgi:hypothetical protein
LKFKGGIIVDNPENAKQIGVGSRGDGRTVWINGSRMDDGNVGCAVVRRIAGEIGNSIEGWNWVGYHLGPGDEVFGAELYATLKATRRFTISKECNKNCTIFSDSQAAILNVETIAVAWSVYGKRDHSVEPPGCAEWKHPNYPMGCWTC